MGDDPNPETEDVRSSRSEDCELMRMVSLHFCRSRPNRLEKDQAWLEEDPAQPETGYPTCCVRYAEINPGIPKFGPISD